MGKKLEFYLLDINHEIVDGRLQVRLWGITKEGARVLIVDDKFSPYFYLILKADAQVETVLESIRTEPKLSRQIVSVDQVQLHFFGRPVRAVKVGCKPAEDMESLAVSFSRIEGVREHVEDDIRLSARYLIDNDLKPCSWHEVEAEEISLDKNLRVSNEFSVSSPPRRTEKGKDPGLRMLSFSLLRYSEQGSPKPERDPIVAISTSVNNAKTRQFSASETDDKKVLRDFVKYIQETDPDLILGYGSAKTDWPYLMERAKTLKTKLGIDRSGTEPHTSLYGHISITGRASLDLFDIAEEMPEVKVKTLDNVARFLGLKTVEKRIEEFQYADYWKDSTKRKELLDQSASDAELILRLGESLFEFAEQLAATTGLPLDQVEAAAVGFRVDSYLVHEAHKLGELIPRRLEQAYMRYRGSIVFEPKRGIHENVAVLDFSSMYPNLMILYNISPDTLVEGNARGAEVYTVPDVGHRFRKKPPGLYTIVLTRLLESRRGIKERLKQLQPNTTEFRTLKEREKAIKVVTNAVYGYAGWTGARWYVREVAESAAALGRMTIQKVVDMAREEGLELIYGDTDSLFVQRDEEKISRLLQRVEKELKLEIRSDKTYSQILFTEAKKRYAGLLSDGKLDIVGLEVVRGDWSEIARIVQEAVISTLLREKSAQKAASIAQKAISDLRNGRVPFEQLIIWKTLTKSVDAYEVHAPHVEAAKIIRGKGYDLTLGDKVGYVIVKGEGKLYERVRPYTLAKLDEVDVDYYIQNQVLPAVTRILADFGVTEEKLLEERKQSSLSEYL